MHFIRLLLLLTVSAVFTSAGVCSIAGGIAFINSMLSSDVLHLLLMPVVIVFIMLFRREGGVFTGKSDSFLDALLSAAMVFVYTFASHICGASIGKEGAGVAVAVFLSVCVWSVFSHFGFVGNDEKRLLYYTACGSAFSGLLIAPVSGVVYSLGRIRSREDFTLRNISAVVFSVSLTSLICMNYNGNVLRADVINSPQYDNPYFYFASCSVIVASICLSELYFVLTGAFKRIRKSFPALPFVLSVLAVATGLLYFRLYSNMNVNGLSAGLIPESFSGNAGLTELVFKFILIVLCVSAGFEGGVVIPFIIVGSLTGSSAAALFSLPYDVMSAIGAVSLFSATSSSPLLSVAIGCELFSPSLLPCYIPAALLSYVFSDKMRRVFKF